MHHFHYRDDRLACEDVLLEHIAHQVGTPTYVYSDATITRHYRVFDEALAHTPHLICFSVKANSNRGVLATLASLGAGADIVSGGELHRALAAGIPGDRIVFSGVGKRLDEIEEALGADILLFNVESEAELSAIESVARHLDRQAPIALRVNPDVDPGTHPYIATGLHESKFGIPLSDAWPLYERCLHSDHLIVRGIDCHIGSQLTSVEPVISSVREVARLATRLQSRGVELRYLDVGGGLGIRYGDESPPEPAEYGAAIARLLREFVGLKLTVICEPGRVIMGNAGVLLARVLYRKRNGDKRFVVIDAAMNDLLRPALYDAFHALQPVVRRDEAPLHTVDVVGPICESGDFLARDRQLAEIESGELLAIMSAGAYAFAMASNYNSRLRPAEVLVKGDRFAVVRQRETLADLTRGEAVPPWL